MNKRILSVLKKLEELPDRKENFWNVSAETGNLLNILTRTVRAKTVLEIGTSNGYSGIWFAEALSHSSGKLYTVESHKKRFELAKQHFIETGLADFIEQIFGHAPEVFLTPEFKKRKLCFDIVFLDATKMEYESYLNTVLPMLNTGGLFIADNVISHQLQVQGFLDIAQAHEELRSLVLPFGSGLFIGLKTGDR